MFLSASAALWFFPFVLPICIWVAWNDMRMMKIPNKAVIALVAVYLVIGFIALPFDAYAWRMVHLVVVLLAGIAINAAGLVGAGDAKFAAAAAPFIAIGDLQILALIFGASLVAGYSAHRIAKYTPLRRLAPEWESWSRGNKYPTGLSLGGTLVIYLGLAAFSGA